jgi:hypothetical protein
MIPEKILIPIVTPVPLAHRPGETAAGGVPMDCHLKIRQIFEYWQSMHPDSGLPGRRHFDPLDVPLLLPNILLVDVVPGPPADFMFRLMGTRLEEFYGDSFAGKPFVSAFVKAKSSQAYIDICGLARDGLPRWWRGPAKFIKNRDYVTTERIYLPLADDGVKVNMVLGLLVAKYENTEFA